ncbi:D-ribose pyranase [Streptomyces sp. H27-C3]|uniref:D-ribose pyranase n=1 Tax=Streptomyces sp. H27-C3 TaxID=3046305 RepID=UPI0024B9DD91|nr:D-ribose pyranase [Streptomyces sp. H27-C3]MDJ0466404.1 D-ribose pyranase [Streptomyces sp. H27-C3]
MRNDGLWHPRLLEIITSLGHGDLLVVADPGLPVPPGVEVVDLVWRRGEPAFPLVLEAVLDELVVEQATVAHEAADPGLLAVFDHQFADTTLERVPHTRLKKLTRRARAIVRTGEITPYANVVLRAGVPF